MNARTGFLTLPLLALLLYSCGGSSGGDTPQEPPASCTDGIQNGDETGIDCGGGCPACSAEATCGDGIQNQDETGVDCGGVCPPCASGASDACNNGQWDAGETGVDCGGPCPHTDCCTNGYADVELEETGVDCGGTCGGCAGSGKVAYFIANDGDDDANSGTLPSEPWASIAKVNTLDLAAGDSVLFKRGGTWRETLTITDSGEDGAHITYGAYGRGPKPRILGSEQATDWTRVAGHDHVWRAATDLDAPHAGHPASIFFGELDGATTWGRAQDIRSVNRCGSDYANLQQAYDWCWEDNTVFVYAQEDPDDLYSFVEVPQRRGAITMQRHTPREHITIDGLELMYGTMYGYNDGWPMDYEVSGLDILNCHVAYIGIRGGDSAMGLVIWHSNMVVRGNEIHDCGRRSISYNVYTDNGKTTPDLIFENVLFEDNVLHNGYHTTGFDISHGDAMFDTFRNFTFRGNFIWDDTDDDTVAPNDFTSMGLYLAPGSGLFTDFTIVNNIIKNPKQKGFAIGGVDNLTIHNNTLYGMNPNIDDYRSLVHISGENANLKFYNNLIYGTIGREAYPMRCLFVSSSSDTQVTRLDHNLYFQDDEGQYITYTDGSGYHMDEWEAYRQATGWDAASPTPADPLFVDPENNDFRLHAGSPAIDAGLAAIGDGRTGDYGGSPIVGRPDIGALEYQE